MPENERGRGILSESDRQWLQNPDEYAAEYTPQSASERRQAVHDRVMNAMQDIALLFRELSDEDLEKIFTPAVEVHEGDMGNGSEETLRGADAAAAYIPQAIAFLARASDLDDAPIFPGRGGDQPALREFVRYTESGVKTWLAREKQMAAGVALDVTLEDAAPIEELVEAARQDDQDVPRSLEGMEIARLTAAGLTEDELEALVKAREEQRGGDSETTEE